MMKKISLKNCISIVLLVAGAWMIFKTLLMCVGEDIWFDELFSVTLSNMNYRDMISLAAKDVHPPLYYIWLKMVYDICKLFGGANVNLVAIGKLAAFIPFLGIIGYAITIIRKEFGIFSAALFMLCVLSMPQIPGFLLEIRMYSLGMFLVTGAFVHGYLLLKALVEETKQCENHSKTATRQFIILFLYGMGCAYTHYFACIAVAAVYFVVLAGIFVVNPKKIKIWCLCVVGSGFSYIPWMVALFGQLSAVNNSYWIPEVTLRAFAGSVKYILKPSFEKEIVNLLAVGFFLILFACIFVYSIYQIMCKREDLEAMLQWTIIPAGIFVIAFVVFVGVVVSILMRPIFVYRYMIPSLGCFWLAFSVGIGKLISCLESGQKEYTNKDVTKERRSPLNAIVISYILMLAVSGFVLTVSMRDYHMFQWEEENKLSQMPHTKEALSQIEVDAKLIFNFNQVQAVMWHYLPNESYLWGYTDELLVAKVCGRDDVNMLADVETVKSLVDESEAVYYLGTGNIREDIVAEWENAGLNVTELVDSCLLERYWFNLYKVE